MFSIPAHSSGHRAVPIYANIDTGKGLVISRDEL